MAADGVRRLLDVVGAAGGLVVLSPLFLLVGIWIRLDSAGPVFYRARRVGKDGREFRLYKFRSMVSGADRQGPAITAAGDSRVTKVGHFLRRSKLDELPQLINVLRGEMSLVGPRPEDPRYVALYSQEQRQVLAVRPGITSAASLTYRDESALLSGEDWERQYIQEIMRRKLAIELDYQARRTLASDLNLVLRTVLILGVKANRSNRSKTNLSSRRIYLSPPHLSGREQQYVQDVLDSNWIAPLGPQVDAFEREFAAVVDAPHALALASGTAALHLALLLTGVGAADEVLVSTFTFVATANAVAYLGARPTFVDSERVSWNMDPALLAETLHRRARAGRLPKAVVLVHLYGQCADIDPILAACEEHGVPLIEDAAEALGASYKGRPPGTFGKAGIFSFNGNKIITTSGGGMLVSADQELIDHALKLATQARDPAPHYEHSEIGYNYRLSNVLAGIGRGQLEVLEQRVAAKRRIFDYYVRSLGDLPGISFMPEAPWGCTTRWLTTVTIDPEQFGCDREAVRLALEADNIEARPLWKPMHLQPVFAGCEVVGGSIAADLFAHGLCLPSGTALSETDLARIVTVIRRMKP